MRSSARLTDTFMPRSAGSVRRTTTLDVTWPNGTDGVMRFEGIGRDLSTDLDGTATVTDAVEVHVDVDPAERRIVTVWSSGDDGAAGVVGHRLGRDLRQAIENDMPRQLADGAVVVQLLDDLIGAWVVCGVALTTWGVNRAGPPVLTLGGARKQMTGVCLGFAPGSSGLAADGGYAERLLTQAVEPLDTGGDPLAWHATPHRSEMSMRRARRIDVRRQSQIEINSMFQDSSTTPAGGRLGIHQYGVTALVDPDSLQLTAISADPRILPYGECPMAADNLGTLLGLPLRDLRHLVATELTGTRSCTHLNDAVRALSGVTDIVDRAPRVT